MERLDQEMKGVLRSNIACLATSSPDGRPNVVPVGLVEPVGDGELLLVDVLFQKTRRNLEANPHVALAVTDFARMRGYQLKGTARIETSGELFEEAAGLAGKGGERRNAMMESRLAQTADPDVKQRIRRSIEKHRQLKPKAAVIVTVEEIYSTMWTLAVFPPSLRRSLRLSPAGRSGATPDPVVGRTDPGLTKSVVCADLASRSFRRTHMTGSSPTAPARVRAVGEEPALPQW